MLVAMDIGRNSTTFHEQQVVTLKIPAEIGLKGEQSGIPVRIFEILLTKGGINSSISGDFYVVTSHTAISMLLASGVNSSLRPLVKGCD